MPLLAADAAWRWQEGSGPTARGFHVTVAPVGQALPPEREEFSLHADVRVDADDRERLERLCRYVTRPPIATERLSVREDGCVVYGLRRPWRFPDLRSELGVSRLPLTQ